MPKQKEEKEQEKKFEFDEPFPEGPPFDRCERCGMGIGCYWSPFWEDQRRSGVHHYPSE
jgi:hypothetical protein